MSIATKTGDSGTTALMYNRRVSKCSPRVEAYGCVDELNTAIGTVRAASPPDFVAEKVVTVQSDLIAIMGELATAVEDLERYRSQGFPEVSSEMTAHVDAWVASIESQSITYRGWATPGSSVLSAALDVARTTCRRAERRVCTLLELEQLPNSEILVYLNRLADFLWLAARWVETREEPAPEV